MDKRRQAKIPVTAGSGNGLAATAAEPELKIWERGQ